MCDCDAKIKTKTRVDFEVLYDGYADGGCYADGARGHAHVREVLHDMMEGLNADPALVHSLARTMPDDAWDEIEAIEVLNDHTQNGHFELHDGDLILSDDDDQE